VTETGPRRRFETAAAVAAQAGEEREVLRVVRESLRSDPPVVRFEAAPRRNLGFFH
jgi:hypothetical protein